MWIDWIRPLWVVLLAWGVVLMTSFPVLVLIQFWGEQLEFRLGTALAIFLIMVAAGSAVLPAYIYLYVRSRNENAVIAAKRASMAVVPLVLIAVLAMTLHAPIRDRVFHALGIQGPQEEYFLISSPMAAQALSMFGFSQAGDVLARGGLAETGLGSRGKCGGEIGRHQRARCSGTVGHFRAADQDCARFIVKAGYAPGRKGLGRLLVWGHGIAVQMAGWREEKRERRGPMMGAKITSACPWPVRNSVVYRVPFPPKRRQSE